MLAAYKAVVHIVKTSSLQVMMFSLVSVDVKHPVYVITVHMFLSNNISKCKWQERFEECTKLLKTLSFAPLIFQNFSIFHETNAILEVTSQASVYFE